MLLLLLLLREEVLLSGDKQEAVVVVVEGAHRPRLQQRVVARRDTVKCWVVYVFFLGACRTVDGAPVCCAGGGPFEHGCLKIADPKPHKNLVFRREVLNWHITQYHIQFCHSRAQPHTQNQPMQF